MCAIFHDHKKLTTKIFATLNQKPPISGFCFNADGEFCPACKIPLCGMTPFGGHVASKVLCVLCCVDQNHSSNASATASSTVMLCPSAQSLAKSESFSFERMTSKSRSTEACSIRGRGAPIFSCNGNRPGEDTDVVQVWIYRPQLFDCRCLSACNSQSHQRGMGKIHRRCIAISGCL